ncbi:hypothetical protein [Paraherbaspirillum soli]|uniref:Uncharacterized protein n=1 Tax=Paraherbaspirillum soli TaxID=631222 RepID=A0ABW0M8F7_9BURK
MLAALPLLPAYAADFTTVMNNNLSTTGEGQINSSYGKQIKNLMIYQAGGWAGFPEVAMAARGQGYDPTWPQVGGVNNYLLRNPEILLRQMGQIKSLNANTAIAVLIMPPEEADFPSKPLNLKKKFGACLNGSWAGQDNCSGGDGWKRSDEMFAQVRWAAWMKGIEVAPFFSINNYDHENELGRGQYVLPKLQRLVTWVRSMTDATSLKTVDGKIVIMTEGLPGNTGLSDQQRQDLLSWMGQQLDILWLDNLAVPFNNPQSLMQYPNIYVSGQIAPPLDVPNPLTSDYATDGTWCPTPDAQTSLKSMFGPRYRWSFTDRFGKTKADMYSYNHKVCESLRMRWLNISPYDSTMYPVIISQWNEYGEFLYFEPSQFDGNAEFNYLSWRLSQQQ